MSQTRSTLQLEYAVPVALKRSLDGKVLLIRGTAIDDTVNGNMWQVPAEELDYFVAESQNAQIRVDHGDRVEDVKGSVKVLLGPLAASDGRTVVSFEGEVAGDEELLTKIEREYVDSVSPRVEGEAYCSACGTRSRDDKMNFVHVCRGAWEVMRKPRMIELSIVSRGAYEHAKFKPVGFAAALKANQQDALQRALTAKGKEPCSFCASAGALSFECLNCSGERFAGFKAGKVNQNLSKKKEIKNLSAEGKPLDAEAIKALIDQHAKNLAEACRQTAEACKSEAEAAVKKAVEAAKETVKLESAAIMAKLETAMQQTMQKRAPGKGNVGTLDERNEPTKLKPGMVAVPSYFKELAAAAEKKKSFDAQVHSGGLT